MVGRACGRRKHRYSVIMSMNVRHNIFDRPFQKGFTLMELMIVLALMAIMAAIAIPNYRSYMTQNRLNGAARMVMTDLMQARSLAATENVRFKVTISGNTYTMSRIESDNSETQRLSRNIQDEYFDVTMTSNQNFVFQTNGTAAAGTVTLTNPRGTRSVVVSTAGRVRIE